MKKESIKAGTLIIVTSGSYSDYTIEKLCVALKDFEYTPITVHHMARNSFDALISTGVLLELEETEIWLDDP